jgi:hypothetical protein
MADETRLVEICIIASVHHNGCTHPTEKERRRGSSGVSENDG